MAAIELDGLTRTFGSLTAVDELSFDIDDGELFGLLGPNGAGKSTLINMLVTLLEPSEGTARVAGHDIRRERAAVRNSLGIVFQEQALDEELTGTENLAFHARMYGMGRDRRAERIDEVLELVSLSDVRDEYVSTYSGGMKRRLEIGRGLLHEPEVLFLDEPTAGLDARTRRDTWDYIMRMNRESGVTIVLTTHYIEEADQLCDSVAIINEGRVAAIDTPAALKDMVGGDIVTVGVGGATDPVCDALDGRDWVVAYAANESTIDVTVDQGERRVADLVRIVDEAGVAISSVDLRKPNLETVFLSLTGDKIDEAQAAPRLQ